MEAIGAETVEESLLKMIAVKKTRKILPSEAILWRTQIISLQETLDVKAFEKKLTLKWS